MNQLFTVIRRLLLAANWIFFIFFGSIMIIGSLNGGQAFMLYFGIGMFALAYFISILINWIFGD